MNDETFQFFQILKLFIGAWQINQLVLSVHLKVVEKTYVEKHTQINLELSFNAILHQRSKYSDVSAVLFFSVQSNFFFIAHWKIAQLKYLSIYSSGEIIEPEGIELKEQSDELLNS